MLAGVRDPGTALAWQQSHGLPSGTAGLLTVPNQLCVEYNAHAIEAVLEYVAPELGWR